MSGEDALVYVLFEHQSTFDALMPIRLLRYIVRVWEGWLKDHPESKKVPVVLPVVMHQGATGWRAAPDLASVLDAEPAFLEATRGLVPHFRFVLDDVGALSLEQLAARTLHELGRLVQMAFWSARSQERLTQAAPLMRAIAGSVARDANTRTLLDQLYRYLLRAAEPEVDVRDVRAILLEIAGLEGHEDVMNAAEQLIEQGRAEGVEKGLAEGVQRGLAEGLRAAIKGALLARGVTLSEFGCARLAATHDPATLSGWVGRAATASTEGDVFFS